MTVEFDSDDFWDDFLPFVEEGRVIPIVGPELLVVEVDGVEKPLYRLVAEKLAEKLKVDMKDEPATWGLNDVVCRYLQGRGRREEIYPKIRAIVKDLDVKPPAPLVNLARVGAFNLFVSLSFDNLLAAAIDGERFGGAERTLQVGYAPNKVADLPKARDEITAPVVYSLFGKLSVAPDYVITEEDMLEFLCALQTEAKRPHLLFDALQESNLLFLGCNFSDWLARFFIRILKNRQLSQQRGESELLVNPTVSSEDRLVLFLQNFSYGTRILSMDPFSFIRELERRWMLLHPVAAQPAKASAPQDEAFDEGQLPDLPQGGVFISYAKEDVDAAARIHDTLEGLGLDVWFDKERLEAGDSYDRKIRNSIKACSLFMPVVSRNTEARMEGYFRREWKLAEERSWGIADGVPFIIPIVIDDTPPYESRVPETFLKSQWTPAPEGKTESEFEMRLVKLVRDFRKREKGLA